MCEQQGGQGNSYGMRPREREMKGIKKVRGDPLYKAL